MNNVAEYFAGLDWMVIPFVPLALIGFLTLWVLCEKLVAWWRVFRERGAGGIGVKFRLIALTDQMFFTVAVFAILLIVGFAGR